MIVRRTVAACALALGLIALPAAAQAPAESFLSDVTQVVKVDGGALKGSVKDAIAYTLGVPFAAPPVGDLRWKPPQPAAAWTGERDATRAGASCMQAEDCLTLNVVRPAGAKAGAKLPVMVWIHGGGFTIGTSMGAFGGDTEGTNFAKQGIVHVSLNYRLGRAGWFAHPALTKEGPTGNYGLMDQVAALKWVQANIARFGGDPKNVTIYGESAGGISVLYLMLAPDAKGLFQKVIAESSFARHTPTPLAQAEAAGVKAAETAGVKGDGPDAAAALRKLPLSAMPYTGPFTSRAGPIVDGRYITTGIAQGFSAGRQVKVPLMIGGNSNEASLFRPQPAQLDMLPPDRLAAVMKAFDPQGTGDKARIVNDMTTATFITEPDRNAARTLTKAGQPVWLYYFSHVPASTKGNQPYGARHADEIRFVFGAPTAKFDATDKAVSDAMNTAWAAFAKSGDPGKAWPRYTLDRQAQIEFASDGAKVREKFMAERLDVVEATQPR